MEDITVTITVCSDTLKKLGYTEMPDKQEVLYNLYDGLKIQEEITQGKWELSKKSQ